MPSPSTIHDLKTAIGGIDDEINGMDERKAELQEKRRALVTALEIITGEDAVPDSPRPAVRALPASEIPDAIYSILEESGTLHRTDIFERLKSMGAKIGGQNPLNNMGGYLSRDPRFRSLGGGMWDLGDPPQTTGDDSQDEEDEEENVPW